MKKIVLLFIFMTSSLLFSYDGKNSFSISSGTEYLEDFYFNFNFSTLLYLGESKEVDIKLAMNLKTEKADDAEVVTPLFNIPLKVGINFLFPINSEFTFLTGVGLSPTLVLEQAGIQEQSDETTEVTKETSVRFLVGPNVKLGLRYKVHPTMSIFTEVSGGLLIGAPKWMYPSVEMILGVNFFL